MATELKLRRDVTGDIDAMTPAEGEPIYDTTTKRLRLGDGSTVGGTAMALNSETATGSVTARTMALRFADVINVKDFGAVGDGVADDTSEIQAALDHCRDDAAGSAAVFVPPGDYLISSALIIYSDCRIYGVGKASGRSSRIFATTDITLLKTPGASGVVYFGVTIEGLNLDRSTIATTTTPHVEIINPQFGSIRDCYVLGSSSMASTDISGLLVRNNGVTWAGTWNFHVSSTAFNMAGIKIDNVTDMVITHSDIWGGKLAATIEIIDGASAYIAFNDIICGVTQGGVYIHESVAARNSFIDIIGNDFTTDPAQSETTGVGVDSSDNNRLLITNNQFTGIEEEGIKLSQVFGATITNNMFSTCNSGDNSKADILLTAVSSTELDTIISGNFHVNVTAISNEGAVVLLTNGGAVPNFVTITNNIIRTPSFYASPVYDISSGGNNVQVHGNQPSGIHQAFLSAGGTSIVIHSGDGINQTAVVTLTAEALTVGSSASLGVGLNICNVPPGNVTIHSSFIDVALSGVSTTNDTPEVGLGTVQASGAVSTLTSTQDDIMAGVAMADTNGTAYINSVATLVNRLTGDGHAIWLNFADAWGANADAVAAITGTVRINYTFNEA